MGVAKLEPIIEIFAAETENSMKKFDELFKESEEKELFEKNVIAELAGIVNIIRRDASMLLYDNIAIVSSKLEMLLDCYRDARADEPDFSPFSEVIKGYSAFINDELYKLTHGGKLDGNIVDIVTMIEHMDTGEVGFNRAPTRKPSGRKRFYIPARTSDSAHKKPVKDSSMKIVSTEGTVSAGREKAELQMAVKDRPISYEVTDKKMEELRLMSVLLNKATENITEGGIGAEEATTVSELVKDLSKWINAVRMTDFEALVAKCRFSVEGMLKHTAKKAEFKVEGHDMVPPLMIERYKMNNISQILTHLIRNSADHGIESDEKRKKEGKPEKGQISLLFIREKDFDGVKIRFTDDGAGMNLARILEQAEAKGLLTKPKEEYTADDILKIPFMKGFTTKKSVGDFSGRGVGLDAVIRLVEEIGGKLTLKSEEGKGTEITIMLPYDHSFDLDEIL